MTMRQGDPGYEVTVRRTLFNERGTELRIAPLLEGIRALSGEKLQWYLASELRDRIRRAEVRITVIDRLARKQYEVEPREFTGRLLHGLPSLRTAFGDAYAEIYLAEPSDTARVALTRSGTRVLEDVSTMPGLESGPWSSRYLQGLLDVPFLTLTPGTRSGVVHDERFAAFLHAIEPLAAHLTGLIEAQRRAEVEQASRQSLKTIQRAFREALLALPPEEYDWFEVQARARDGGRSPGTADVAVSDADEGAADPVGSVVAEPATKPGTQKQFFEFAGPLFSVVISPAASLVRVGESRRLRALPRDRSRRRVEDSLEFSWTLVDGGGVLEHTADQEADFHAPAQPGLSRVHVTVTQRGYRCEGEATVTVTETIEAGASSLATVRGLPGYTLERAAGELWRSRYDAARNLIVVNNGHRDFVFATRSRALQLRYLVRLYVKELVLLNFAGLTSEQLLERMVELSLYAEEQLKPGRVTGEA
jgi:hypothetical protein